MEPLKYIHILTFCVCFICETNGQELSPIVDTKYGAVQGTTIPLHYGVNVHSFLTIPYARAPEGERRFMVS